MTAIIILAAAAVVFCVLWLNARADHTDLQEICESELEQAYQGFSRYAQDGEETRYWYAVADYTAFLEAVRRLPDYDRSDFIDLNRLQAILVERSDEVQSRIGELCEALSVLNDDYRSSRWESRVLHFINTFEE